MVLRSICTQFAGATHGSLACRAGVDVTIGIRVMALLRRHVIGVYSLGLPRVVAIVHCSRERDASRASEPVCWDRT